MSDIFTVKDLNLWYGAAQALHHVSLSVPEKSITALIGPSGCGKSTFLKTLDRMNDLIPGVRVEGQVLYRGEDIYAPSVDVNQLRREVGMVFQKPNPVSHEHLRQRGLRPPYPRRPEPRSAGRAGGKVPARRCHLGRGEGIA